MSGKGIGRRDVLKRALVVLAAAPMLGSALEACGGGEPSCAGGVSSAQLTIRGTLHYRERGSDPSRACSGCQLYTGNATTCGTCISVPGSINPGGTCDAFSART
jgi:hypothetical protein